MVPGPELLHLAVRHYPAHALVFGVTASLGVLAMVGLGAWWLFWPLAAWTFAFAVHFLVAKSQTVSRDWIEKRTTKTADKAYDFGHIQDIRESYEAAAAKREGRAPPERPGAGAPPRDRASGSGS